MVVVVNRNELVESEVASQRCRLVRDALLKVSVSAKNECVVVKQLWSELRTKRMLGKCETNCIGKALSERTRRDLDAWSVPTLGVSRRRRSKLSEVLYVIKRETKTGEIQHRILED